MPARHPDSMRAKGLFGQLLVDGNDRRGETRMGIFDPHQIEHALHGAVFAGRSMQRIEDDIRADRDQHLCDISIHIDAHGFMAQPFTSIGNARATRQRHVAFGRPAAHEDRDFHVRSPIRWISHSSMMPECFSTF